MVLFAAGDELLDLPKKKCHDSRVVFVRDRQGLQLTELWAVWLEVKT